MELKPCPFCGGAAKFLRSAMKEEIQEGTLSESTARSVTLPRRKQITILNSSLTVTENLKQRLMNVRLRLNRGTEGGLNEGSNIRRTEND